MKSNAMIVLAMLVDVGSAKGKKQSKHGIGGQKMANEKRLIDANALVETFEKWKVEIHDAEDYNPDVYDAIDSCVAQVEDALTVDAVEVVRCKNCEHWKDGVSGCTDHVKVCEIGFYMVGENGYCVYAERKGE